MECILYLIAYSILHFFVMSASALFANGRSGASIRHMALLRRTAVLADVRALVPCRSLFLMLSSALTQEHKKLMFSVYCTTSPSVCIQDFKPQKFEGCLALS